MKLYRLIIVLLTATFALAAAAEPAEERKERPFPADRVKSEAKIIRESLHLTGDSANRFTQIFTDYNLAIHKVLEKKCETPPKNDGNRRSKPTQEQIDKNIKARFAIARALLDIRENYYPRFREVLSPSQYEEFMALEQQIGAKKRHEHERRKTPPPPTKESKKAIRKK